MLKKKIILAVSIISLFIGLLTYQSIKGEGRFVDFPVYPLSFLERGADAVINGVKNFFNRYILIVGKEAENQRLRYRIFQYEQDLSGYEEMSRENERLKKMLDLKSERHDYVATAKVFARDPTNWFQMFWINKGSNDGIERDMVVTGPSGPVGRIHRVHDSQSSVMLITDVNSSVAARLQTSRIEGILEGSGKSLCYLKYVAKDLDVKVDEKIITSGLDGIYPGGFLIGTVSRVEKEGEDVFQLIEVVPSQELNAVEEVVVLKR